MRTQPLFHLRHSPFSHLVLVTSVNLYGYGILAFDRQVAGLSPTDVVGLLHILSPVYGPYLKHFIFSASSKGAVETLDVLEGERGQWQSDG